MSNLAKSLAELLAKRESLCNELEVLNEDILSVKVVLNHQGVPEGIDDLPTTMMGVIRHLAAVKGYVNASMVRQYIVDNQLPLKIKSIYPCLASKSLKKIAPNKYVAR